MISEPEGTGGETRRGRKDEKRQLEVEERGSERGGGEGSERGRESGRWRGRGRAMGRGRDGENSMSEQETEVGGGVEEVGKGEEERRNLEDMEREVEVERVREKECERTKQIQG